MSRSLNKVTLIGHIGNIPEVRHFQNGGKVANFSLATSESWIDKDTGEKRERTQWHRVCVHVAGLVDVVVKYVTKGSLVYIEGQLETRKWQDQEGKDQYTTEVVLRPFNSTFKMLETKDQTDQRRMRNDAASQAETGGETMHAGVLNGNGNESGSSSYDLDDDIPF